MAYDTERDIPFKRDRGSQQTYTTHYTKTKFSIHGGLSPKPYSPLLTLEASLLARGSILRPTWYFSSSPSCTGCLKIILPQCADIESMSSSGMSIVQSLHCCHYYRCWVNACIANQFKRAMWGHWKIHQSTNSCESTSRWERRWQVFRRDMLGNCLALMVKWSIEAAGPIYHADTMHGRQGRPQQPAHNDNTHIQLHTRCKDIAGNFLVCLCRDNFRKLDVLFVAHILCWWWSAESMVVGKFCGKVVNLSDKKPCTEKRAEERGADGKCTCA